jgi:hypothetical protein
MESKTLLEANKVLVNALKTAQQDIATLLVEREKGKRTTTDDGKLQIVLNNLKGQRAMLENELQSIKEYRRSLNSIT